MARPKKIPFNTADAIYKLEAFQYVIDDLKYNHHPAREMLPDGASLEHRALKQIAIQEFEKVLKLLQFKNANARKSTIESTYNDPKYK